MEDFTEAPPLLTVSDLEDLEFSGPFTDVDVAVACALVRGACQWHIAPSVTVDLLVDVEGGPVVTLPSLHVTDVVSVEDANTGQVLTGWSWSRSGILHRPGGWPEGFQSLLVRVVHGFAHAPLEVAAVVAGVARSRMDAGKAPAGLKAKTVGGVTYQYLTSADEAGDPLEPFRSALWRYERR